MSEIDELLYVSSRGSETPGRARSIKPFCSPLEIRRFDR